MEYHNTVKGNFIIRHNRFEADVRIGDKVHRVHVKNTGRCKELLIPGCEVILEKSDNPNRKTAYDLIAVYKERFGLINMDSQAPNKVVLEWLKKQDFDYIKPEYTYGNSRVDFYMEKNTDNGTERYLMEVKGCTLEVDGIGYFPDAPTIRGVKHIRELQRALQEGFHAMVAFVIQMEGVKEVRPNAVTHPEFALAFYEAKACGVQFLNLCCKVEEERLEIVPAHEEGKYE